MTHRISFALCVALAVAGATLRSPAAARAADVPSTAPTTQPTTAPVAVAPDDKEALAAHQGQAVTVGGTVADAQLSPSGRILRVHLKEGEKTRFQAVVFQKDLAKFDAAFGGDFAKAVAGKTVQISGKLADYRGAPEVVLSEPSQVTVAPPAP